MRISLITSIILLIGLGSYQPNPLPASRHKFIVIAHRGDHVIYPENTLEAYQEAIKNEADYVEIDLRTSKDGELVSMHDGNVDRMSRNVKGAVKELTLSALQQIKIKSKDSTDTRIYRIPTFKQILKLCKSRINIYLDFKEADPAIAYQMIKDYGMENQILVYINSKEQYAGWRKVAPTMPLMLSLPDSVKSVAGMESFVSQYQPDLLDGSYNQYTNEMVAFAAGNKLAVWPDIQSKGEGPADWDKALAKNLNGLQTDHPKAFVTYLKGKGLR